MAGVVCGGVPGVPGVKNLGISGFLVQIGVFICRHLQGPWMGDVCGTTVHIGQLWAIALGKKCIFGKKKVGIVCRHLRGPCMHDLCQTLEFIDRLPVLFILP